MRQCATITIGDVMKKKIRVCENSMVLVYILAMSGGFMDAYSYMCRGEVFANAQTGNILLMAVNLAKGNFVVALRYFAPVMAFIAGVVLAQTVHHIFKGRALHRRQIVILFEAAALFAAAFIPYELNILCNCIISLACGAQVEAVTVISVLAATLILLAINRIFAIEIINAQSGLFTAVYLIAISVIVSIAGSVTLVRSNMLETIRRYENV